ncbi:MULTISPECIES: hypothetical protein [unclassified Bradyrhizobium]|uniref:hypothetical protein n=1 Tax=unclassified Bradyrhizobium TaxID=2631580 RepID=UPI0024798DCD|nr:MULTISPECIES: hypothetical protein [unclassified Bradyrhizobium]WGS18375.1 hypothetical protein MTX22_27885 [Bradyrhizobium sp. ISRA463]WGS25194.1 hypothetical protein MTX19_25495 [Bradyrhizobium sp. ISRA464]
MSRVLLVVMALVMAVPALAEEYEKGPHGGLTLDVAGIDAELLTSGTTVTINVFKAFSPTPISTKGYVAAVLITGATGRETVTLVPSGENSLKGDARNAIAPNTTITLTIKTADGKSGQVKFKQ